MRFTTDMTWKCGACPTGSADCSIKVCKTKLSVRSEHISLITPVTFTLGVEGGGVEC